jgi:uncharacterized membrane protein YjgN (DUF898 family)
MAAPSERVVRPQFTGSANEYFRVWIVNLFFSLVTLGFYSAWAKVRKKRYFYGSTRFDGDSFDYFGSPRAILIGRIIAVLVFLAYALLGELYPHSRYAFWGLALLLLPWLVVRALTFNARNTAFRGLRFDFCSTPREAARVYIGMLTVVVLTAGLAYPWFMARQKAFVVSRHAFGVSRFACELPAKAFFGIYLRAALLLAAFVVPAVLLAGSLIGHVELPDQFAWLVYFLPALPMYAGYAAAYAYSQARTVNLMWNNTEGPGMRFSSTLSAYALAKLYLGNMVAVACSAGLLLPWAVVRTLRYRLENFAMTVEGEGVHDANPALARVGATGQELGDIFNLELGL